MSLLNINKKQRTLKFNIDKRLSELFEFIISYMNENKSELFQQWIEASISPSSSVSESSDTVPVEFTIDEKTEIEFNFALKNLLKNVKPDVWLEQSIRRYCAIQLDRIKQELRQSLFGAAIMMSSGKDAVPEDYIRYLDDYDRQRGVHIKQQYEIAFRCRIISAVRAEFGKEFFQIDDLNELQQIYVWAKEQRKNNDAPAIHNYIKYLKNKY